MAALETRLAVRFFGGPIAVGGPIVAAVELLQAAFGEPPRAPHASRPRRRRGDTGRFALAAGRRAIPASRVSAAR